MLRRWSIHNLIGHPLSELAYWLGFGWCGGPGERWCNAIHDATLPEHEEGTGRG